MGEHTGGNVGFSFDITDYLTYEEDILSVYVEDIFDEEVKPRGKQHWKVNSEGIWYSRTTGIWQTVWMEPLNKCNIKHAYFTPDIDKNTVKVEVELSEVISKCELEIIITFEGEEVVGDIINVVNKRVIREFDVIQDKIFNTNAHGEGRYWSPENPKLFDVRLVLKEDRKILDEVKTYFGMRKIHTENGLTYLNNRPYYFRLVLDQGYWP